MDCPSEYRILFRPELPDLYQREGIGQYELIYSGPETPCASLGTFGSLQVAKERMMRHVEARKEPRQWVYDGDGNNVKKPEA